MNRLSVARRIQVLQCLVDGCSMRATTRIVGAAKNTVANLLVQAGRAALDYQDATLVDLPCKRLQMDEIWAFVGCKAKNVKPDAQEWRGDVWTWTALCDETKLVPAWLVGGRDAMWARFFIEDVALRLKSRRVQFTTDGHRAYIDAINMVYGNAIDYAQLVKQYGCYIDLPDGERRYSPSTCTGFEIQVISGDPDPAAISTSFVERQNLTMRMGMRRFTRLTNAFSKKMENLRHAVSLHFLYYNFVRRHDTLGTTPAYAAGVADRVWSMADVVALVDAYESVPGERIAA